MKSMRHKRKPLEPLNEEPTENFDPSLDWDVCTSMACAYDEPHHHGFACTKECHCNGIDNKFIAKGIGEFIKQTYLAMDTTTLEKVVNSMTGRELMDMFNILSASHGTEYAQKLLDEIVKINHVGVSGAFEKAREEIDRSVETIRSAMPSGDFMTKYVKTVQYGGPLMPTDILPAVRPMQMDVETTLAVMKDTTDRRRKARNSAEDKFVIAFGKWELESCWNPAFFDQRARNDFLPDDLLRAYRSFPMRDDFENSVYMHCMIKAQDYARDRATKLAEEAAKQDAFLVRYSEWEAETYRTSNILRFLTEEATFNQEDLLDSWKTQRTFQLDAEAVMDESMWTIVLRAQQAARLRNGDIPTGGSLTDLNTPVKGPWTKWAEDFLSTKDKKNYLTQPIKDKLTVAFSTGDIAMAEKRYASEEIGKLIHGNDDPSNDYSQNCTDEPPTECSA